MVKFRIGNWCKRGSYCENCPLRFECFSTDTILVEPVAVNDWPAKQYFRDNVEMTFEVPECIRVNKFKKALERTPDNMLGMCVGKIDSFDDKRVVVATGFEPAHWRELRLKKMEE